MPRKLNKYHFKIGNGFHDIMIAPIYASTKADALKKAMEYRGVPTDKITLISTEPYMVLNKGKWVEV